MIRKFISYLLVSSVVNQGFLPVYAGGLKSLDDIEYHAHLFDDYDSLPTALNFIADPNHTAAGSFLYAQRKDTDGVIRVYALLGLRDDMDQWCNFSGSSKLTTPTMADTAAVEVDEESYIVIELEYHTILCYLS